MGPLRFRKGELKVTFKRPLQLKGDLMKGDLYSYKYLFFKCLAKATFTNLKGLLSKTFNNLKV